MYFVSFKCWHVSAYRVTQSLNISLYTLSTNTNQSQYIWLCILSLVQQIQISVYFYWHFSAYSVALSINIYLLIHLSMYPCLFQQICISMYTSDSVYYVSFNKSNSLYNLRTLSHCQSTSVVSLYPLVSFSKYKSLCILLTLYTMSLSTISNNYISLYDVRSLSHCQSTSVFSRLTVNICLLSTDWQWVRERNSIFSILSIFSIEKTSVISLYPLISVNKYLSLCIHLTLYNMSLYNQSLSTYRPLCILRIQIFLYIFSHSTNTQAPWVEAAEVVEVAEA